MGLVGRRLDAAVAAVGVAVLSAGVLTAQLTAVPTRAAAAVSAAPRPAAALSPRLAVATAGTSTIDKALTATVRDRLSRATAAGYGVVIDIAGRGRVVSVNPNSRIRPASTQKLFTTLPMLLADPDRRLVTDIRTGGRIVDGVLHGNLVVKSSGDPSLLPKHLSSLSRQVLNSGVRKVVGELRLDIGDLPLETRRSGWQPGSVPYDVGPLSPFPVREDIISRSSSYLRNPTAGNLKVLRQRLAGVGISISGGNRIVRDSSANHVIATHSSASMSALIRHTLLVSDNLFAESLLSIEKRWRVNRMLTD